MKYYRLLEDFMKMPKGTILTQIDEETLLGDGARWHLRSLVKDELIEEVTFVKV